MADQAHSFDDIFALLESGGRAPHEAGPARLTGLQHALQCAELAASGGSLPSLVAAALLHDIGWIVATRAGAEGEPTMPHEEMGADYLSGLMPASVTEPIRLHVHAKRYLCATQPGYFERLTPAARASLAVQGGPMEPGEAMQFLDLPFAEEAVRLRLWDEEAKVPGRETRPLEAFRSLLLSAAA